MAFLSCEEMLAAARSQKITLAEAVLRSDLEESRLTEAHSRAAMRHLWQVMQATSQEYDPAQRSRSGLSGGDAAKVEQAWQQGRLLGDDYLAAVTAEALKTAECNACMKRIVAAPTAGSCGVLPAVLLPLARAGQADEDAVCDALYVAAGFGQVIAARATLAGAEGGCQAEVGAASAMAAARSQKITLAEAVLRSDLEESRLTEAHSRAAMHHLWQVMQATSQEYDPAQRSRSGLSGGDAAKVEQAWQQGRLLGDDYLAAVTAEALKTAECNACMKRIVAAPTAGSCGVLPAVLLPLARAGQADEDAVCDALYVAAGFGQVIAARATLAGAEGGCQAEVGAASAMAAAALCNLKGGTPEQCAAAAAMALGNLLGLVCDPVAGLVEVPCIKRNVVGAVNAVSCANMALAGVDYAIPCDEVIDAMGRVGSLLSPDLRETGQGGLAATPTGVKIARQLAQED